MNEEVLFNDTLDNFNFSNSENNVKTYEYNKLISNQSSECQILNPVFEDGVSIDDSAFLNATLDINTSEDHKSDTQNALSQVKLENYFLSQTKSQINRTEGDTKNNIKLTQKANYEAKVEDINIENEQIKHVQKCRAQANSSLTLNKTSDKSKKEKNLQSKQNLTKLEKDVLSQINKSIKCTIKSAQETTNINLKQCVNKQNCTTQANFLQNLNYNTPNKLENEVNCKLSSWGLPETILIKYKLKNVIKMFPWQAECLNNYKVLKNYKNLVYSAPTSAGKTLIAEILAIKTIFEQHKKVLFILPFVSVVREKMYYFQDLLKDSGIRVEGFMGSQTPPGGFKTVDIAVCTIEKANGLINRLLDDEKLSDIGVVVVDEMHLLGDSSRGYLLELLLTKLKYMSIKNENINIQIIGMSATLPNLDLLAKWLNAELYVTYYRPIPLYEQIQINGEIYNSSFKMVRCLSTLPELGVDTDNILQLSLETILNSCSVLIFCPTKHWCENLAQQLSSAFWKLGCSKTDIGQSLRKQLNSNAIAELLEQLKRSPTGLDHVLGRTVSFAVAFHHAGLTMDERDIIEGAFRNNVLRVLVATSTLSSGVNLPARRVIIRTPMFHGKGLDNLTYKQMIGRAGRMGRDTQGESFLICQKNDYKIARELLSSELMPIESCLEGAGKLKRAILEVIASGVATTPADVKLFTECTLLAIEANDGKELINPIEETVEFLERNELIRLQTKENSNGYKYIATPLGKACLSSSMPPEEGLALFAELEKARQCFVLETELHLIYLVTPYSVCYQLGNIDWMLFLDIWEKLPASMKRVGELVGIKESYIITASRGKILNTSSKQLQKLIIHKRFYTALALQELVNETPLNEVAIKFNCSRGLLQSLQQSASTFAGMVTSFTHQLGWSSVEILISQFQDRLHFGVSRELLDLMKLSILNGPRARALYNFGVESLIDLAKSDILTIENILHKVIPFESGKERDGETKYDAEERNKFRTVWITGKYGITEKEAAEILIQDARKYLQYEMGLKNMKWDELDTSSSGFSSTSTQDTNSINDSKIFGMEPKIDNLHEQLILSNVSVNLNNLSRNTAKNNSNKYEISDQSLFEESFVENNQLNEGMTAINNCTNESALSSNEIEGKNILKQVELNSSNDFIANSQITDSTYLKTTPAKRKRRKTQEKENNQSSDADIFEQTPSKKKKLKKKTEISNCLLKIDEIKTSIPTSIDLTEIEIINVCRNEQLFKSFAEELLQQKTISIAVGCIKFNEKLYKIGDNILNEEQSSSNHQNESINSFTYKDRKVDGIAFSWGGNTAYYIDLNTNTHKKIELIKTILIKTSISVRIFDCKEHVKVLKRNCNIDFLAFPEDPKIGDWLLEPETNEKNLQAMALKYIPEAVKLAQIAGSCKGVGSVSVSVSSSIEARTRAVVEAVVTWHLVDAVYASMLEQNGELIATYETEMKCILCLTKMELNGIPVNSEKLQNLTDQLTEQMENMKKKAFELAGRNFSFTSSTDVAKVLGIYKGRKISVSKQILEKNEKPIANLILQWRKLSSILTKMIYPLMRLIDNGRIHGCVITHHSTGRISMHEPNLQNVARDFDIINPTNEKNVLISCRSVFCCPDGYILVSADYCQLELRILAHFSQDSVLCSIMNSKEDVFRSVAAEWNNIPYSQVDDVLRQHAKQMCYGIIYGVGIKTLSEQLNVSEEIAKDFMQTFHNKYPGIKTFIKETIEKCRENGYVETLKGRRRFLPHINHNHPAVKTQAERQAVNTTIQGTAADITKAAMILIESNFEMKFHPSEMPKLVLNLHDEFLYEIPKQHLTKTCKIIRKCMEKSTKLTVSLPVKCKSGISWGNMIEFNN